MRAEPNGPAEAAAEKVAGPAGPEGTDPAGADSVEGGVTDLGSLGAAACHAPLLDAWTQLESTLDEGVLSRLRAGARAHREAIEAAGLTAVAPEAGERSERLLDYRRVVASELLEPLGRTLRQGGPAATVGRALANGMDAAWEASAALPATLEAAWPADALAPKKSDRWTRRAGKLLARVVSGARKAGRVRAAPLRSVVAEHLRGVVAPREDQAVRACMAAWAAWTQQVELAVAEWGDEALSALIQAERLDEETASQAWSRVAEAASGLDGQLSQLIEEAPRTLARDAEQRLGRARGELEAELAVAGSFLRRASPLGTPPELSHTEKTSPALADWDERVAARIDMTVALLSVLSGATAVQRRLAWRFRESCGDRVTGLSPVAASLEERLAGLPDPTSGSLRRALEELHGQVMDVLPPAVEKVADRKEVEGAVRSAAESAVETLMAMVRQAPQTLVLHAEGAMPPRGVRVVETRTVPFQELARQSFDALRVERIRAAAYGLVEALTRLHDEVAELPAVFTFAYEAALKELEEDGEESRTRAVGLVSEAVGSIAGSLRLQVEQFETAVADARGRFTSEISAGSESLIDRIAAGRMQAGLLRAQSRVADARAWVNERWGPPVDRAYGRLLRHLRRARVVASRGLRRGSEIVGGPSVERAASARAIRALADPKALTDRLPLVYQRLFSFAPLTEPGLLAGREKELNDAVARWARWKAEDGVPIVVRGRQGSGITSFSRVLCARIEEDEGEVVWIDLPERITDEGRLAAHLAEAIGLPAGETLADLATAIFEAGADGTPDAVALDNLEHLYLRVPGGTDLVERLLTLMAETEPMIFWIGGVTTSAWQLITTAEPTAIAQVDVIDLKTLEAGDIRSALTLRHRRSGLPVRFEEPAGGHRMLRHRLRRMRDPDAFQQLLEIDFFERIERASAGYLRLALFQWLQAADFDAGDGLLMKPPQRPDFSILDGLDLTQNFTLKAFLEHRTLTLAEHDRIFRLPRHESYQIFEALGNRHLIAAVGTANGEAPERSEVEEDLRYEVQPLLVGAVINHLRSRNIVH